MQKVARRLRERVGHNVSERCAGPETRDLARISGQKRSSSLQQEPSWEEDQLQLTLHFSPNYWPVKRSKPL